jgi:hypothetical protein
MNIQAIPSQYAALEEPSSAAKSLQARAAGMTETGSTASFQELLSREEQGAIEKAFGVKWATRAGGYHPSGTMKSGGDVLLGRRLDLRG